MSNEEPTRFDPAKPPPEPLDAASQAHIEALIQRWLETRNREGEEPTE